MCRIDMAKTLEGLGRTEEAAALRRENVDTFRQHLGDAHPTTLYEAVHLANDLSDSGHHAEAQSYAKWVRDNGRRFRVEMST
jgi:hypothetical protein